MPTERIDIILSATGPAKVKRSLDNLADSADKVEKEVRSINKALNNAKPTTELKQALEQITNLRKAVSGPLNEKTWLQTSITSANKALETFEKSLTAARKNLGKNVEWDAVEEFQQAEQELDQIIRKLQTIRTLQAQQAAKATVPQGIVDQSAVVPVVATGAGATAGSLAGSARKGAERLTENRALDAQAIRKADAIARGDDIKEAQAAAKANQELKDKADEANMAAKQGLSSFTKLFGALGLGFLFRSFARLSDDAKVVANRINIIAEDANEAAHIRKEFFEIARETRAPVFELSTVLQKILLARKGLGATTEDALTATGSVGMALAIQGSNIPAMRGVLTQISQAVSTQVVRGEEFNSMLEGAFPLLVAASKFIDDAYGSVGVLRLMAVDGQLSSKEFFDGIVAAFEYLEEQFAKTNPTISQGYTVFRNELLEYIDTSEEAKLISSTLADTFILMADNITPAADALFSFGIALAFAFTGGKVKAILTASKNVGLLATAMASLRAVLGFLGGPIVGGLALLAGTTFWVSQNTDTAADKIDRLQNSMDNSIDAVEHYNLAIQRAADDQRALGGIVGLTTQAIVNQSRAQLQDALAELQNSITDLEQDIKGAGIFDLDNIRSALAALHNTGLNPFFGNNEIENLYNLLEAIQNGTGNIDDFVEAVNRVRGAGPEITKAVEGLGIAIDRYSKDIQTGELSPQGNKFLKDAESQLTNIALALGGFNEEIVAVIDSTNLSDKINALVELKDALEVVQEAGFITRNSSHITDTANLLKALKVAREQEQTILEALSANANKLQKITEDMAKLRKPLDGSTTSIEQKSNILDATGSTLSDLLEQAKAQTIEQNKNTEAVDNTNDSLNTSSGIVETIFGILTQLAEPIQNNTNAINGSKEALERATIPARELGSTFEELTDKAKEFQKPLKDGADAAEDTGAALNRINFSPLEDGARGFADELIRAALAIEIIRGRASDVTNGGPRIHNASYSGSNGSILAANDNSSYGDILTALGNYGGTAIDSLNLASSENLNSRASASILDSQDRTNQSDQYLSVLTSINQELDSRYNTMVLNNRALDQERAFYDATQRARAEGIILSEQDIILIRGRVAALDELEQKIYIIEGVSESVFGNLESSILNFVKTGTFSFKQFASSVISDLARIGTQTFITKPLSNFFNTAASNLFNIPLPAANEGADFIVGGSGGVDNNVLAFRASRGERVQVTPVSDVASSYAGNPININFHISTPDVESFRRSEGQIAARAQRILARGQRNT